MIYYTIYRTNILWIPQANEDIQRILLELFIAISPIFLLIMLGYAFHFIKFPSDSFWNGVEKFSYFVLAPSLLINRLSSSTFSDTVLSSTVIVLYVLVACMVALNVLIQAIFKQDIPSFTSIVQGSIRFNLYTMLATVLVFYNDDALVVMAVIIGLYVPLINIICVLIFAIYFKDAKFSPAKAAMSLLQNPLVISSLLGITLGMLNIRLPYTLFKFTMILGNAALPMGLLPVGYALRFSVIKSDFLRISQASVLKLCIMPLIAFALSRVFHLSLLTTNILVLFASQPTAVSAYILAKQLGGNYKLMASIIYTQTVVSFITIPIIVQFLRV